MVQEIPRSSPADDAAAVFAVEQLERWRANGFYPSLYPAPDGWTIALSTNEWFVMDEVNIRSSRRSMKFASGHHPSIVAAVQAAQEVIK